MISIIMSYLMRIADVYFTDGKLCKVMARKETHDSVL